MESLLAITPFCCSLFLLGVLVVRTLESPSELFAPIVKGICPRGNNKVNIIIFHVYDKCLFLMLELY
jgi:hypothetical protein